MNVDLIKQILYEEATVLSLLQILIWQFLLVLGCFRTNGRCLAILQTIQLNNPLVQSHEPISSHLHLVLEDQG